MNPEEKNRAPAAATPLVAHIIYRLDVGGLENGLVNIINRMPENSYRHAIICLTKYSSFRSRIKRPDVEVYALNKKEGKDFAVYFRLWKLLRRLRPQIVHTRNLAALDCTLVALLAGVPLRIHGEHGWDVVDLRGTSKKYRLLRRLCGLFIHRFIPMSKDLHAWLVDVVGIRRSKVVHIYNGVDMAKFRPHERGEGGESASGFKSDERILIGYVGRMEPVKDPMNLARAFVALLEKAPAQANKLQLAMIGDGPLRPEVEQFFNARGVQAKVWLPGNRDDVRDLLPAFDVFVLPSLAEGISNTILEAMASGLPVIATRVGGNPELVLEGETGMLVPAADPSAITGALLRYIQQPGLLKQHGRAALARAQEQFDIGRMVDQYKHVYDELTAL